MKSVVFGVTLFTLLLGLGLVHAADWYVPADFMTIQQAIDDPMVMPGDMIHVADGIYYENINFNGKDLILMSDGGYGNCTIDGGGMGPVISVVNGEMNAMIMGFTITNGYNYGYGGGVSCMFSTVYIDSCHIANNQAYDGAGVAFFMTEGYISFNWIESNYADEVGGGIYVESCYPNIDGNTLENNYGSMGGGGIACRFYGDASIQGNTIDMNSSNQGGGIYVYDASPWIAMNDISFNEGMTAGAGLYFENSFASVSNNQVYANGYGMPPWVGGGMHIANCGSMMIDSNYVFDNNAGIGAGMYVYNSAVSIFSNTIENNNMMMWGMAGGGIYCEQSGSLDITANSIRSNQADEGAGIYCSYASPYIMDNDIEYNQGNSSGGGIYCYESNPMIQGNNIRDNYSSTGGGMYLYASSPEIGTWATNYIDQNSASEGGGIYCYGSSPYIVMNSISMNDGGMNGGGIACFGGSDPMIDGNIIQSNHADHGGGICCQDSNPVISGNQISDNNSGMWTMYGGGIYCYGSSPSIFSNYINYNSADNGGGVYCSGGSPSIVSNTIDSNNMMMWGMAGGGISCESGATPDIAGNTITYNFSSMGGGIYCYDSTPTIDDNYIQYNETYGYGGGICLYMASPEIGLNMPNTISDNRADMGGGIYCYASSPIIVSNTISGNNMMMMMGMYGGGISLEANSNAIIIGNSVYYNYGDHGGGIYCYDSSPMIDSNSISDNQAPMMGGGLYFSYSMGDVTGNQITNNNMSGWAMHGGGIACENGADVFIAGNTIENNGADSGGGIYVMSSSPDILSNSISMNNSSFWGMNGGGIYCYDSSSTIEDNSINDNSSDQGAGIYCDGGSLLTIRANTISYNGTYMMTPMIGGGIYCGSNSDALITDNYLEWNRASSGAGIFINYAMPTISGNNLIGNQADSEGGAISCYDAAPDIGGGATNYISSNYAGMYGGGIFCYGSGSSPAIFGNQIDSNFAGDSGGGIYCMSDAAPTISANTIEYNEVMMMMGAGIACDSASPVISGNTISSNGMMSTMLGGGIACTNSSAPMISGNDLVGNAAADAGGAIYCSDASPLIVRNTVSGNMAIVGAGIHVTAGAAPIISVNEIMSNTCSSQGGGIAVDGASNPVITNNLVAGNLCGSTTGGGAMDFRDSSVVVVADNTVTGNESDFIGGVYGSYSVDVTFINTIVWGNTGSTVNEVGLDQNSTFSFSYSDVAGGQAGVYVEPGSLLNWMAGNIDLDPLFASGPDGAYYLSQISAGQAATSPCVDNGEDAAVLTCFTTELGTECMDTYTTHTGSVADLGTVDMGYHYEGGIA
ncbi:right-handed parallel beta-helix repeat-containing protein, partial [bacterium]|nr:right-handed parallel beta-helix repeat-containing protein [candidate division CSSED10-310 bacterium]